MDLYPSDMEEAVRSASEAFLRDNVALADARERPDTLWPRMAEMGWLGITIPEDKGGVGLGYGAEALVFAELGRHLAPVGIVAGAVAAGVAQVAGDEDLLARIVAGKVRVGLGLADSGMVRVIGAGHADHVVIVTEDGSALHARGNTAWNVGPCLDPSTDQARIAAPEASPLASAPGSAAARHQMIASAAFALGAAEAARDMAAAYAAIREQFDKPIGSFQGVKHLCADMAVRASAARAQLLYAALALDEGADRAAFQVAVAKRLADMAAIANARANVQVHGGIGMTDEADVHLILKRAHLLQFISPASTAMLLA